MAARSATSHLTPRKAPSSVSTYKTLESPAQYVKGVGERLSRVLGKLGIFNVRDLIYHFPKRLEDRSRMVRIGSLRGGEEVTISGAIIAVDNVRPRGGIVLTKVMIDDGSGVATLTWFNQHYLKDKFYKLRGHEIIVYGNAQCGRWGIEIQNPEWEEIKEGADPLSAKRVVPVYPLTEGIFQGTMRKIVSNALDGYLNLVVEILPEDLLDRLDLMDIKEALRNMHFPESMEAYEAARKRLVFEELFLLQLALRSEKEKSIPPVWGYRSRSLII